MGQDPQGLIVHHDQDSVYTSYLWLRQLLLEDEAVVSYCEQGAKDNPWMESFWAHFKGENMSLFLEAATLEELEWVIGKQMGYYNNERRHSWLEYRSPVEYLTSVGFIPKTLAEIGLESGSVSGAQALFHGLQVRATWFPLNTSRYTLSVSRSMRSRVNSCSNFSRPAS